MLLKRTFTLKNKIEFKAKEKIISKSTKKEKKEKEKEKEENFPPKKLSNYINTDNNIKYILKNKSALKEYEIFLNRFKKKKKITFGSINNNYQYQNKMSIFKDNPRLIISSYKANFTGNFDDKKVKFQNNILGVDEGLIILPKINIEEEQNKLVKREKNFIIENIKEKNDKEDKDKLTNIYSNTELKKEDINNKINNNIENQKNSNTDRNNNSEKKMKSVDIYRNKNKNKNIKESYLERGEEVINRYSTERNIKKNIESYNNKGNKTLDNFHHFNYEIRRLNKWDFNNITKIKKRGTRRNSLNTILTEIKQSQRLSLLTEIKHNKEQFKIISRNKHLKDFINKINEDQNAIFMQNIKVFKKNFNFSIFEEKKNQNDNKDKYKNNSERKKTDTYSHIIKKKVKLEDNLSHEVGLCAEDVYIYKNKIEKEKKKKFKLSNHLYKLQKKEEKKTEEYNDNIKRLDLLLQQLENAIMQKNLDNKNKNGSESKNNNIKYNESTNKLLKSPNIYRSTNMGNLKSKTISIINSVELTKIRTLTSNKENKSTKSSKFVKFNTKNSTISKQSNSSNDNNNDSINELIESKDEELMIKNNLLAQKNDLDNEHKKEMLRIKEEKDEIKNELNKINNNIIMFSKYLSKTKTNLNEHINSLSDYYYQILKKGIDVRRNGLSWVVVKLMELNAFIDYNHFPNFLDIHQINYLMKIGTKIYEVKELIKLFQLLKEKEKAIKEEHYDEDRKKEKEEKQSKFNEIKRLNGDKIGNNYVEYLEEIQHKYDNAVNFNIDEEIEDKNIIKTSKYLKDIIMHDWERNMELYYIPGSLAEYFSKDKKFREYFDDAYYLKEEINKRQNDIKKDKEKELNYYRNKYKILYFEEEKDGNKNNNLKKDFLIEEKNEDDNLNIRQMIFAALFGNSTPM